MHRFRSHDFISFFCLLLFYVSYFLAFKKRDIKSTLWMGRFPSKKKKKKKKERKKERKEKKKKERFKKSIVIVSIKDYWGHSM